MRTGRYLRDSLNFFRTLSPVKIWNLLLIGGGYFLSLLLKRPVVRAMPHTLSVEPATLCNLSCPECPVGNNTLARPGGVMADEIFFGIVDQFHRKLLHLILYFQGEPFLDPGLFEKIRFARSRNIYVSTSTNGHFLNRQNIDGILSSGLDRLIISLDGATQETYQKYRVGGDFDRVVQGIRQLVKSRDAGRYGRPFIILQFLMFRHNLHERDNMKKLTKELGVDRLEFKTAQFYDLSLKNTLIPEDPAFSRYRKEGGRYVLRYDLKNRCPRLWTTAVITWDGKMVPCCFDKNAEYVMGDLKKTPARAIWLSEPYNRFRERILTGRSEVEMCRNCTEGMKRQK